MKILKKIALYFLVILLALNVAVFVTGNTHLYSGLADTYFQGRTKPGIENPDIFYSRLIESGESKPWAISKKFNTGVLSEKVKEVNLNYGTVAFLVIHKDSIVQEEYFDDYDNTKISNSFSMAKTILSVLAGMAVKDGKLNIEESVCDIIPDFVPAKDSALKVRHLINMTSGMNFKESYGNPFGFMAKAYYGDDLKSLVAGYHLEKEPGTEWKYLGGNNLLLSILLEKKLGMKVGDYANQKLWKGIKAETNAKWVLDHEDGDEKTFSGFFATARDFAKIGELYMNKGNAFGKQLVDTSYVEASIQPVNVNDIEGNNIDYYGYAWWLVKHEGLDVFYMRGILGQYVFCIPEKDLIVVRLGRKRMEKSDNITPDDVKLYISEGLSLIE